MKKRMFITTIVMTLVLAVALTTSSLAWFSSANATVTANAATFTASTASGGNVSLKIKKALADPWGLNIDLTKLDDMAAAIPVEGLFPQNGTAPVFEPLTVKGESKVIPSAAKEWPNEMKFNSAKIDQAGNFTITAGADGKTCAYTAVEYTGTVYETLSVMNGTSVEGKTAIDTSGYLYEIDSETGNYSFVTEQQRTIVAKSTLSQEQLADTGTYVAIDGDNDNVYKMGKTYVFTNTEFTATSDAVKNPVKDLTANDQSEGFYKDTFYLLNADKVSQIDKLTFSVTANVKLSDTPEGDTKTADSYVAFILFNEAITGATTFEKQDESYVETDGKYTVVTPSIIYSNAQANAGKYVVPYDVVEAKLPAAVVQAGYVKLGENDTYVKTWVPFAAFSFKVAGSKLTTLSGNEAVSWQYADLDDITVSEINPIKDRTFTYNGVNQSDASIRRQTVEKNANAEGGYTLDTTSWNKLNKKAQTDTGVALVATADESPETFVMYAQEVYKVDMYFWLDGLSLADDTDATVTTLSVSIAAAQND